MAVMGAGSGFAKGFAEGMEKNFREMAAADADAAKLAAARYEENRKNFKYTMSSIKLNETKKAIEIINNIADIEVLILTSIDDQIIPIKSDGWDLITR